MSRGVSTGDWQNAVKLGNLPALKTLYRQSLNINAHDSSQRTALHWAAALGQLEIVDYLVKAKADIEATDKAGRTALHLATGYGELEVVKYLVNEARLDVSIPDDDGKDALQIAYSMKKRPVQEQIVAILENAPPPIRAQEADLPEDAEVASQPFRCGPPDYAAQGEWGNVALLKAARDGKINVMRKLLREGKANVKAKDKDGWTAVHWAAAEARLDVLRFLITEAKAEPDPKDNDGSTPMDLARMFDKEDVVSLLMEYTSPQRVLRDADKKSRVTQANAALLIAAESGVLEAVMSLLNDKADIHASDDNGDTPLHLAVRHQQGDVVHYLLEAKAGLNVQNQARETPLSLANDYQPNSAIAGQLRAADREAQMMILPPTASHRGSTGSIAASQRMSSIGEHSPPAFEPSMPGSVNQPSTVMHSPSTGRFNQSQGPMNDEPSARLSVIYPNSILGGKRLPPVKSVQNTTARSGDGSSSLPAGDDSERSILTAIHAGRPSVISTVPTLKAHKSRSPSHGQRAAAHLVVGVDSDVKSRTTAEGLTAGRNGAELTGGEDSHSRKSSCHCSIL